MTGDICFGVRIQTFNRPKPQPIPKYVAEAINCVKRQTYTNWKIFLIGDDYRPRSEFKELAQLAPKDKIVAYNLPCSPEREIHGKNGYDVWACGGITSFNYSLDLMNELGITHCANLDDDDIWFPRHLEFLYEGYRQEPKPVFVATYGHFKIPNYVLPMANVVDENGIKYMTSIAGNNCNCACSWDIQRMPLRAKNCVQLTAWAKQCWDYWFWRQFEERAKKDGLPMLLVPKISVFQRHTHLNNTGHL